VFVQVITGKVSDADAMAARGDAWEAEVKPGAEGFLGSTGGITADGKFIVVARFADRAAAEANNNRPEQTAWFEKTAPLFDGDPDFEESEDVEEVMGGGSDDAGFVQVMRGTATDRAAAAAFEEEWNPKVQAARPDLLGGFRVWHDGGRFTELAYFTSEAEARAAESGEMPADLAEAFADFQRHYAVDEWLDLTEPFMH
jgi:hypothetical protein